jgi:hypothetical protein
MDGYILTPDDSAVIEQNCNTDQQSTTVCPDEMVFFRLVGDGVLYSIKDKAHSIFNINKTN